ncbi:hypothetical protein AQI88_16550 [Streptomyces cellostaticus]|uniref:Uncharacterized protein n=1 Tax=Streptomyces cellostaticus TaxID=67285 RepID=A0A101NMP5_9ACTN|nr:hypothetical protein [Streptomyces cellostaticus]KUM95672.1 hypothetical protein AQI88_16550 [Streptomyces cellostaticus]GHI09731.1 hypothetical protein Scel_80520 [Streptomyces cellostaticus]
MVNPTHTPTPATPVTAPTPAPPGSGTPAARRVADAGAAVLRSFRGLCHARGYREERRRAVVSDHDLSIRYTNSTISVLKPLLSERVRDRVFLVQPALRLRNLDHVRRTGTMSPWGCAFMSFGALAPPGEAGALTALARDLLVRGLGVGDDDVRLRLLPTDGDLVDHARGAGVAVIHCPDTPEVFRHRFGIEGITGRNANLALRGPDGWADVANVIVIERHGRPIGAELAFGVNAVLVHTLGLGHPVRAGAAAAAEEFGVRDLVALDALSSATVLAMDGLRPVARGRGQNYRALLRLLDERAGAAPEAMQRAAGAVARAEEELRRHASPPADGVADLSAERTARQLVDDLCRVAPAPTAGSRHLEAPRRSAPSRANNRSDHGVAP